MVRDLTTGSVPKLLLSFAFPFMLSNLLQTVYNMVDMMVVGQYVGKVGLSAVGTGSEILHMVTFVGMGFSNAGQVMISQYVGRKDMESVKRTIGSLFTTVLSAALILMVICLALSNPILNVLNVPEEAYSQARDYSIVCYLGLFFIYGYNAVSAILRGMGDSRRPFVFIAIAAIMNLILDLIFVAGFGMASFGAALATVIGQAFSFIVSIIYLYRHRQAFGFDFKPKSFRVDRDIMKVMMRLGLPMMLQSSAISISMMFVTSFVNTYGVVASAVTSVGNKIAQIMNVVSNSVNMAGASMIGQNLAAGKRERVPKVIHTSLILSCGFALLLSIIMALFPEQVFSLFNTEAEVLAMSHEYVPIAILLFFGFATRAPFFSLINGIGFASFGLFVGLMDGVIARIGLILIFTKVFNMGLMGIWLGNAIAGYACTVIGGGYYLSGKWKKRKLIIGGDETENAAE
jgi:putative MATE family efflux protein